MDIVQLGFGSIGQRHFHNAQAAGFKVAAGADPFVYRMAGVPVRYGRAEEALEKHAAGNAVVIATPNQLHAEQAEMAIKCGAAAVLIEKPLCLNELQYRTHLQQFEESGIPVAVAYNFRFHRAFSEWILPRARSTTSGILQALAQDDVTTWPNYSRDSWMAGPTGGVLPISLSHSVDMAICALGSALTVSAAMGTNMNIADSETFATLHLTHERGVSVLHTQWIPPPHSVLSYLDDKSCVVCSLLNREWEQDRKEMHARLLLAFMDAAEKQNGDLNGLCSLRQGFENVKVLDAARRAWAERRTVEMQ